MKRLTIWMAMSRLAATTALWPALALVPTSVSAASDLDEVLVTARKREEPVQEVPLAVSVLRSGDIDRLDLRSAADLTARAPNIMTPANAVIANAPTFFIRGVGQGDHNWNTENGVAVFVDDVYVQSTSDAWIDLNDFARIEILRGPQGTLYGRNSTSGAIKFAPRRPDLRASQYYVEALTGSRSRVDLKGGINLPFANGAAAAKLDAYRFADDGAFTRVDLSNQTLDKRIARREHSGLRVATLWRPGDRLEIELNGDVTREDNGMNIVTPIVPVDPAARNDLAQLLSKRGTVPFVPLYGINRGALEPLTVGGDSGQTSGGVVLKIAQENSLGRLRSISAWRSLNEHFVSQLGGRGTPSTIFGVTLYGNVNTVFEKVQQLTQEFQLNGSTASRFDYAMGAYFFHNRWRESEYGATNGVPANLSPFTMPGQTRAFGGSYNDIDQRSDSWAIYANLDWHVREHWTVSLGARHTWDRKDLQFRTLFENHTVDYPGFPLRTSNRWNQFTPRAGIDWRASENLLAYVNYARGYKVGNVEGARSSIAATAGNWLAPELASTWEAGLKSQWLDGRLKVNAAIFSSRNTGRTDLISPDRVASSDLDTDGFEAEASFKAPKSLEVFANIGLLHARYRNLSANHPALAPDPTGFAPGYAASPPMTPKYTLGAGVRQVSLLGGGQTLTTDITALAVGRHFHALGLNNFDSEIVAPYAVTDASVTWQGRSGSLRLTLGAHNLLDRRYYANGLFGAIPEFAGRYYADGRTAYLRIGYSD